MIIYPAIDIRNGRCVRLIQGDFDQETRYAEDPVEVAQMFASKGAQWIHVVDLDGAADSGDNLKAISGIIATRCCAVQVGGGIRTLERIEALRVLGAQRIIVGTMPIETPERFEEAVKRHGDNLAVAIDVRDQKVATHGWQHDSVWSLDGYVKHLEQLGVRTIIVTDISRDGMLQGPNVALYASLLKQTNMSIIASGGIGNVNDVEQLRTLGVAGVIIGKALYEHKFALEAVL